jgi:hypothetical protein
VENPPIKPISSNFFITKSGDFDAGAKIFENTGGRPEQDCLLSWDGAISLCEMLSGKSNFKAYVLLKMMRATEKQDLTAYKLGWEEKSDEQKAEDDLDDMICYLTDLKSRIRREKEATLRKKNIHQLDLWPRDRYQEIMYEAQTLLQKKHPTISLGALAARSTTQGQTSMPELWEQRSAGGAS